jgi:hypothetical protein
MVRRVWVRVAMLNDQGTYGVERMSVTNYPPQSFEAMSRKQAIATCYALEDMRDRASIERDALRARNERQHATLTKIRALLGDHDGPLWAVRGVREADIRKALTEPTPKGKP